MLRFATPVISSRNKISINDQKTEENKYLTEALCNHVYDLGGHLTLVELPRTNCKQTSQQGNDPIKKLKHTFLLCHHIALIQVQHILNAHMETTAKEGISRTMAIES